MELKQLLVEGREHGNNRNNFIIYQTKKVIKKKY